MSDFFSDAEAIDEMYRHIVEGPTSQARAARRYANKLWQMTAPYLDRDLTSKAPRQFHQTFWEMYLAAALLDLGLDLKRREARRFATRGPDIQIGDVTAWIEAVAVTKGAKENAVPETEIGEGREVPHDRIKLRLLNGRSEKQRKYECYRKADIVRSGEPCVIAINDGLVPSSRLDLSLPRIVSAVFPFGIPVVSINTVTEDVVESFHLYQGEVRKNSGVTVPTTGFLSPKTAAVSAVLYGSADVFNHPASRGLDFILVHNPCADHPLPRGLISRGLEYWQEGAELRRVNHGAAQDA